VNARPIMLWSGLAIPPISWLLSLEANFILAPLACGGHGKVYLYLVTSIALALAIGAGGMSWLQRGHDRALAIAGGALGVLFALVIFAQSIPTLLFSGCE
jgi:hypothetical protein